jgi:hypothetical protein
MTPSALMTLAALTWVIPSHARVDLASSCIADARQAHAAELMADASSRTSPLEDDGGSSGFVKGRFTLGDGSANTLMVGGLVQNRFMANFRDRPGTDSDYTGGFQIARARLRFNGSVWDKAFTYNILTELVSSTGSAALLDAEARYTFENRVYVRAGQFKPMFNREELVNDVYQLTAERSTVNSVFSMSRSQGAGVGWTGSQCRVAADIHDGAKALNTDFDGNKEADFAITARGDWMFAGDNFKRFDDFTSFRGSAFSGMIGGALDWETFGDTGGGAPDKEVFGATVDASLEGDGWNVFAAFIYRDSAPAAGPDTSDYGFVAQAGFFVTDQTELFARYDGVFPADASGPDNFNAVTAGANYFLSPQSHAAKLTGDIVWYVDAEADSAIIPAPSTNLNLLTDTEGDQVAVRLQLQVLF